LIPLIDCYLQLSYHDFSFPSIERMLHARNAESMLRFPGDPNAPASEVINCHCVLIPGVLLPDEELGEDGEVISTEALKDAPENGKIAEKANGTERNGAVQYVGRIDLDIYKKVTPDITTDEVVITDERLEHIRSRHPNDYEKYKKIMLSALKNPDYILETSAPKTAFILKASEDPDVNGRVILRLQTPSDSVGRKNSIITFQRIKKREYDRLVRNKKIIYKSPDL